MKQKTPVLIILLASAFMLPASCRVQLKVSGEPYQDSQAAQAVLNICNAPYFADPTGKQDCTEAISISLRKVSTSHLPVGLTCTSPLGHVVLVDSELDGKGSMGIDHRAGGLYVSNVTLTGFDDARHIDEWVTQGIYGETGEKAMSRLQVEDTPVYERKGKTATGIRRFGAIGNGINDDSTAIQAALNSGAENAGMRISTTTYGWGATSYYGTAISDKKGEKTETIRSEDLPLRPFDTSKGPRQGLLIPLYK